MNQNIKVAKELIKMAKSLLGYSPKNVVNNYYSNNNDGNDTGKKDSNDSHQNDSNQVADKPGLYTNFSGRIEVGETKGKVRNATFEILDKDDVINWKNGIWVEGTLKKCFWEKGTWESGDCYVYWWHDGTFKKGTFNGGNWKKGTFEKDGIWTDGAWCGGTWDKDATWVKGTDGNNKLKYESPDKWAK